MNQKELMELVNMREGNEGKVEITFDDSIPEKAREKFLSDVDRAVYYAGQNDKAIKLVTLWLKWVVLPTAVILLVYFAYLGVMSLTTPTQ